MNLNIPVPECAVGPLAELGFVNGMYGGLPFTLIAGWTMDSRVDNYVMAVADRRIGTLTVEAGKVTVELDLARYLREPTFASRQAAKSLMFAQLYGMGKTKLATFATGNHADFEASHVDYLAIEKLILAQLTKKVV